jgi:uncharacterized protein YoxC
MTNQKGGVRKKNNAISDADALRSMITSSVSNKAISYGSLKCFVWVFDITPANSQYDDINVTTGQLNRPVTKYVIKVVITNPNISRDMPNSYVDPITGTSHIKSSDAIDSLVQEANTQQLAWIKTFSQGVYVECPSVASSCFFDNQNGKNFVNFLRNRFGSNNMNDNNDNIKRTNYICQYLLDQLNYNPPNINDTRGIAVILMPLVGEEEIGAETATLHDFINFPIGYNFNGWIINEKQKDAAFSSIIASVIRLFIAGIIHMDLHGKNSLIYYTRDRRLHCKILDFGNSSIFTDNRNDSFLNRQEKSQLVNLLAQEGGKFLQYTNDATDAQQKIALVKNVMNKIQDMDRTGNNHRFQLGHSQMGGWWNIIRDTNINYDINRCNKIMEEAYNIARRGEAFAKTQRGPSEAALRQSVVFPFNYTQSAWSVNAAPAVNAPAPAVNAVAPVGNAVARGNNSPSSNGRRIANQLVQQQQQQQQAIQTYIKIGIGALGVLLAGCGYGLAKKYGYLGGGDGTTGDIEQFIKDNDLTQILKDMKDNDICPINIGETQKEALEKLTTMTQNLPQDAEIELPGPQEAGRRKRRRSRKIRKAKKTRKTRRTKKQRKTRRR